MRLIRLSLTNFRQHAYAVLDFRPGLTGIIGPNGSGKTTILEAIAWSIYGSPAVRGTLDTLRFNRAPGRSKVEVSLEFELAGERYRVTRGTRNAELFRGDEEAPIAAGISEVTRQLTRRLGMNREEFFNTYFTGQKELQFLAAMKPNERRLFLSQVLGYERLREAQGLAREERKVLKGQIEELYRGMADREEIDRDLEEAERRLGEATEALSEAEAMEKRATQEFGELEPSWAKLQAQREKDRGFREDLRVARTRLESAVSAREGAEKQLAELEDMEGELEELRAESAPYAGLAQEEKRLRGLAEAAARRSALESQLQDQRARVDNLAVKHAKLEKTAEAHEDLAAAAAAREQESKILEQERDQLRSDWQRDRQDVDARIRMLLERADELKTQVDQIEEAGPEGVCPTCQRPLGAEYDRVLADLRAQWEETVDEGKWHRKREQQLEKAPAELAKLEEQLADTRKARDAARSELAAVEAAGTQLATLEKEIEEERARARTLAGEIAALPEGYDPKRHEEVRGQLEKLQALEKKIAQLETRLEGIPRLKAARAEAEEEVRQIEGEIKELEEARAELDFSEDRYGEIGEAFDSARSALDHARLEAEKARGELEAARHATEAARKAADEHAKTSRSIKERERDQRLHNELDAALGALRDELNDRIRPELSEIASVFLTELTDGRYSQIEIGPDYDIVVLDAGEEKPVISGGEEDLANLVLRLAISQMIADRAGQTLSLLIFDEVFGSLDEQRRDSVVRLLQRLQDRFEQVVLITHIESIRDGMDQVVRCEYDEDSGASVVVEESPGAGDREELEELAEELAARA